jgi:DNA-binding transcriptional MocR family regulator
LALPLGAALAHIRGKPLRIKPVARIVMNEYWTDRLSHFARGVTASEIRELLKVLARPEIISFAGGIPDPQFFPVAEISAAYAGILRRSDNDREAFQYSISEGYPPLRQWISGYMAMLGVPVPVENILITNGSQQGLDFVAKLLVDRGAAVAVSRPSYLGALQSFSAYGARFLSVPMDEEGMLLEPLERALQERPALLYLVPDFANPSGVTTSLARRTALVALARRYDVPVIEDAAYERLRYSGPALPPLLKLDSDLCGDAAAGHGSSVSGNVIYLGTFSKTIAPALRVGWTVAPATAMEKLVLIKQAADLHNSTINQMVAAEVAEKVFHTQPQKIIPVYAARRDTMLRALARYFPPGVTWTRPAGGMFIWLELPPGLDARKLLEASLAQAHVAFVPGAAFHADGTGQNTMRLSFSTADHSTIEEGVKRLGALLHQVMAAQPRSASGA